MSSIISGPQLSLLEQKLSLLENALATSSKEEINPLIISLTELIISNGALWKTFKCWSKSKQIAKTDLERNNINKTANIIESTCLTTASVVTEFKELILKTEKLNTGFLPEESASPLLAPSSPADSLRILAPDFLREAMRKGYKAIKRTLNVIAAYDSLEAESSPTLQKFIKRLNNNLRVWLLHYLARGSKIPILEQRGPLHISPLEYHTSNQSEYYRHDGGALTSLLLNFLKKKYSFPKNNNYIFEVIKPGYFSSICQTICRKSELDYHVIEEDINASKEILTQFNTHVFLDVSISLQDAFSRNLGKDIDVLMNGLCRAATELNKAMLFGGIISIEGQTYYFLFSNHKVESFAKQVKECRGGIGAIPDMAHIEHQLIREEFPLQKLFKLSPALTFQTEPDKQIRIEGDFSEVVETLNKVQNSLVISHPLQTQITQVYFELFKEQLRIIEEFFKKDTTLSQTKELGPLIQAIENFGKRIICISQIDEIQGMTPQRKFQEILQEVYLATEEISFILCFIIPSAESNPIQLRQVIEELDPQSPYKQSYLCTSGMSGYWHVFESLKGCCPSKPKIAFLDTTYYEIVSEQSLGGYLEQFAICANQDIKELLEPKESYHALCMDIYPNYVPISPVHIPPISQIIYNHLTNRSDDNPLTVILDATGSFFWDIKIIELLNEFEEFLRQGKLDLIVITSLAKFAMGGLDKYTGGIVQIYNTFSKPSYYQEFNRLLKKSLNLDSPSGEAEKFFFLFMQQNGMWLKNYLKRIQKNTDRMYKLLASLQEETSPICLCEKDKGIPIIGFSFKSIITQLFGSPQTFKEFLIRQEYRINLTYFMQYFLAAKALAQDFPISTRMSFGFASMNFTECAGALRFTVGLEDPNMITDYAKILINENGEIKNQLQALLNNPQAFKKMRYLLGIGDRYLANWMEMCKLQFINYAKNHTFTQTIEFIYDQLDPKKIIGAVLSSLPLSDTQRRFAQTNCKILIYCIQKYLFTQEGFNEFIQNKLCLFIGARNEIYEKSKNNVFIEMVRNNSNYWLEFLATHSLLKLKDYMISVFCIENFCCRILEFIENEEGVKWLNEFKEKALDFAKDHTFEELKEFIESSCYTAYSENQTLFSTPIGRIEFRRLPGLPA